MGESEPKNRLEKIVEAGGMVAAALALDGKIMTIDGQPMTPDEEKTAADYTKVSSEKGNKPIVN